jgi:hypothetical protein
MSTPTGTIPYERQSDPQAGRTCGAACLSMVYRSFGKDVSQAEIWPAISKLNQFGSLASTTHLMTQDALNRGLAAVAIQARHPLQALKLCHEAGLRAILNHRLQPDVATGHYTVMLDLDDSSVVLHDPYYGPSQRVTHAELAALWQPRFPNAEIVGNVLIAIAADPPPMPACQFCHTVIALSSDCPRCKKAIGLRPGAVLGCINPRCIARMWNYVCCPACDFMLDAGAQPVEAGNKDASSPGTAAQAGAIEPASLNRMFAEIDKFCSQIQSIPGAAKHAELQQQLQALKGTKAAVMQSLAAAAVYVQTHKDQLAAFAQAANARGEAHRKKMEALNAPPTPLDGTALGRALLKNLGFIA